MRQRSAFPCENIKAGKLANFREVLSVDMGNGSIRLRIAGTSKTFLMASEGVCLTFKIST